MIPAALFLTMKDIIQYARQDDIVFPMEDFKIISNPKMVSHRNVLEKGSKVYHEEIEIKYFYEGSATLRIGDDTIIANAGDIIVINPYEFHATIDITEQNSRYHLFMISLDFFSDAKNSMFDLRSLILEKHQYFNHRIPPNEYLQKKLLQIIHEIEQKAPYYKEAVKGLLLEFFALLMRNELRKDPVLPAESEILRYYTIIEPSLQKIRDHYAEKLSVDELASLCNVSKCHFCRIFKLVTKQTVVQYITEYRLKIADIMLEHTGNSIAQIAQQCGFMDESYFCRHYKKLRGVSPNKSKYRKLTNE